MTSLIDGIPKGAPKKSREWWFPERLRRGGRSGGEKLIGGGVGVRGRDDVQSDRSQVLCGAL